MPPRFCLAERTPRSGRMAIADLAPPAARPAAAPAPAADADRLAHRWLLALVALGLAWRLVRYLLRFPFWGDEAFVGLNLPGRGYLDLTGRLRHDQVAPVLFLWG